MGWSVPFTIASLVIVLAYAFLLSGMKKPLFPEGNKDRKYNFCGTTLFAGKTDRSAGANTPCAQ